jgi:hypothetical protein
MSGPIIISTNNATTWRKINVASYGQTVPQIPQTGAIVPHDPFFSNVVLLDGFEGANGSTGAPGMTDESPAAHGTATVAGATIDTSQFKFGTSSAHLVAASSGIIWWNTSTDWVFGSGLFTVETWVMFNTVPGALQFMVADWTSTAGAAGWYFGVDATGNLSWTVSTTGSNTLNDITAAWSPSTGVWYFVTVDFDGIKYRAYINGVTVGSSTTLRTIFNPGVHLALGSNSLGTSFHFDGWLDETRITKGVARYATDTSFAVPTAAFPRS